MKMTRIAIGAAVAPAGLLGAAVPASAIDDTRSVPAPGGGTLTANAWHDNGAYSGSTIKVVHQVSAVAKGTKAIEYIRTTWEVGACMRNSASLSIGIAKDGVSAGGSSTWQCKDLSAYWQNANGAKTSDWRATAVVKPDVSFQRGSFTVTNVARLKIKGYAQDKSATASI